MRELEIFSERLNKCLEVHKMNLEELPERTAIEFSRLQQLLVDSSDLSFYEFIGIVDCFRVNPLCFFGSMCFPLENCRLIIN